MQHRIHFSTTLKIALAAGKKRKNNNRLPGSAAVLNSATQISKLPLIIDFEGRLLTCQNQLAEVG